MTSLPCHAWGPRLEKSGGVGITFTERRGGVNPEISRTNSTRRPRGATKTRALRGKGPGPTV